MGKSLSSHLFQMLSATFCGGGRDWGNTDSVLWLAEVGGLQSLNSDWSIGCLSFLLLTQSVCLCPCQRRSTKHINNQYPGAGEILCQAGKADEILGNAFSVPAELIRGAGRAASFRFRCSTKFSHGLPQCATKCHSVLPHRARGHVTMPHTASQDPSLNLRNFAPMSSIYFDRNLCLHQKCIGFVFHPVCNVFFIQVHNDI